MKVVTPDNQVYPVEFSKVDRQDNKKDDLYDLAKLTFSSEKDKTYLVAGLGEENIKPGEKVFAGGYVKGNLQTTKGTAKLFLNQPYFYVILEYKKKVIYQFIQKYERTYPKSNNYSPTVYPSLKKS